ncbi:MAG: PIN domain-containing protein [Eggerthellaceae bacterium]|jgi:predicted nucleic acid-binding protein|nr:PIN domain-containing protein [Eggerthellaceae bacterium]MDR2722009.1 PIN domain-containing protein [Coriobacteriaceae bacterium]
MKILFDCNVVIDVWGKTDDFFLSYASFDTALTKEFCPCITATSIITIGYVLAARKYLDKPTSRQAIGSLFDIFEILDIAPSDCRQAYESDMDDYEDAHIAYAAKRHGVDFIITRNKRDFLKSPVPALTPEEFLHIYKPDYLEYEMVDF